MLGEIQGNILVAKATSKVAFIENNPDLLKCVLKFVAGECDAFPAEKTYIDPNSMFPIDPGTIGLQEKPGNFRVLGSIESRRTEFVFCVKNHPVMTPKRKKIVLGLLG